MFKHVTKSRKLAKHQREARLSDEDSSGASASEPELDSASGSGSDASDSEGSDSDSEFDKDEVEAVEEEEELLAPAPGYPTIEEAVADPIAQPTHEEGKDGELVEATGLAPVCVVCVNKVLKAGTMLEVHKKSKDHLRRHARFVAHVKSDEFNTAHLALDAVSLVARLDAQIANRATASAATPTASTSQPAPTQEELAATVEAERLSSQQKNAALKAKAAAEGRAKREVLREAKQQRNLKKRGARNEKKDRLRANAARAKQGAEAAAAAEGEGEAKKLKAKKVWGVKPTDEQIAARQAKKVAAREAEAKAKGLPPPPPPIHPTPKTVWADQLIENNDKADKAKIEVPPVKASKKRSRPAKAPKTTA